MLMRAATVVQVLQDFEAPPTIAPRLPTTVANPHIDRSLGSKETHIQSHNRFEFLHKQIVYTIITCSALIQAPSVDTCDTKRKPVLSLL